MEKEKSELESVRREVSNLKLLTYQAVCCDVMRYTVPCSVALESASLPILEAITQTESAIRTISKLSTLVSKEGISTPKRSGLFPTLNKEVISNLTTEQDAPVRAEMNLCIQANER